MIIFTVGVIGIFTISSQTVFASENELRKFIPDGSIGESGYFDSENGGEQLRVELIKNNEKFLVDIIRSSTVWDLFNEMSIPSLHTESWNSSNAECKKIFPDYNDPVFYNRSPNMIIDSVTFCIINNEYLVSVSSEEDTDTEHIANLIIQNYEKYDTETPIQITISEETDEMTAFSIISSPTNFEPFIIVLLWMIIIILLIVGIVVIILLKKNSNKRKRIDDENHPQEILKKESNNVKNMEILKERLAKGEITKQEYDELKKEFEN